MTNNAASELTLQAVPSWMPAFLVAPMIGGLSLADLIALVVLLLFVLCVPAHSLLVVAD